MWQEYTGSEYWDFLTLVGFPVGIAILSWLSGFLVGRAIGRDLAPE